MPFGDDRRHLQWHTRTVCGLDVAGALLAVERADQQLDLARPAEQKEPVADLRATSTGVKAATIGMTASAPATSARSRSTVSIGNRPLMFGRDLDHPGVGGVGERRAERVERADELGFEYQRAENHRHPQRDADHAEQRPAPVGDQRGEVDAPEGHPSGAQPLHHGSAMGAAVSTP